MKILFITPSIPNRLNRIRAYQLIKYLSREHKVHLLSLVPPNQEKAKIDEIEKYCESINIIKQSWRRALCHCLFSLLSPTPLEVAFCKSVSMNKKVKELVKKISPDLIYVKRLRAVQYVTPPLKIPTVLDVTDAMSLYYRETYKSVPLYKKPLFLEEWRKYRGYEKKVASNFKIWLVASERDKIYLQDSLFRNVLIHVVPNGVDLEYYKGEIMVPEENMILFSGLMNKHVNISAVLHFAHKIFPKVKKCSPDAKLYIVGPDPGRAIRKLNNGKDVIVTGYVGDIREYLARARVVVCPVLVGTGMRNKILQAWARQRPVVSTSVGASGLKYQDGENILIADEPEAFADHVVSLLGDASLWHKISQGGRATAGSKYDMAKIVASLAELLRTQKNVLN